MNHFNSNPVRLPRSAAGFSLVEVLIAMGIFAVGFVSVAAMFPAGAMLQRETVADVESQLVSRNAAAQVRSHRLTFVNDTWAVAAASKVDLCKTSGLPTGNLEPLTKIAGVEASTKLATAWKLGDRSYPTAQKTIIDRKYYWVPFIRRTKTPATDKADWLLVVFVLRRDATLNYAFGTTTITGPEWANMADGPTVPKVVGVVPSSASGSRFNIPNDLFPTPPDGVPDQVRPGDFVADNNGVVYNVVSADATGFNIAGGIAPTKAPGTLKLWYAPPPIHGVSSPCTRILLLTGVVEDP
jgi:prepilin-type N-terminal cleavage/methylation domain-containing protein